MKIERGRLTDEDYRREVVTQLYSIYGTHVYYYCISWLGIDAADDALHDVFHTAYKIIKRLPEGAPPEAWLLAIAKNKCRHKLRNHGRHHKHVQAYGREIAQRFSANPAESFLEGEVEQTQLAQMVNSYSKLTKYDQLLIRWRYMEAKSVKEIAEMLGKRENTVSHSILRALERLRKFMDI